MSSEVRCVVCKGLNPKLRLFRVPSDSRRLQKWSASLKGFKLKRTDVICGNHFNKNHLKKSKRFDHMELTNDATPRLQTELVDKIEDDIKMEDGDKPLEDNKTSKKVKNKTYRNISIQTELEDTKTCAFVTVSQNFMYYNVKCVNCDESFSISDWENFTKHIQDKHRYEEDTFYDCGVQVDCQLHLEVEDIKIETENNETLNLVKEENSPVEILKPKEEARLHDFDVDFIETVDEDMGKISETSSNSDDDDEDEDYSETETAKIKNITKQQEKAPTKKITSDAGNHKAVNVDTSDATIVFGFLDLLQTYPLLWFFQRHNSYKFYDEAFEAFCQDFNNKYNLNLRDLDMRKSLRDIGVWYRNMFENENFTKLVYPQNEYYKKCAEFLPDKPDGKSCDSCKIVLPDHLHHFIHKKLKHPETVAADDGEVKLSFGGIPKEIIDNYLYTRYPIGKLKKFQCQVCFQNCRRKTDYFDHIKAHLNIRDFVCDICGASFVRQLGFKRHKQRHIGPIKRTCKICNKSFNDNNLLGLHRRRYHRPIEGTIEEIEANCYKRAPKISQYKTRIDPRTNKRSWICHFCEIEYSDETAYVFISRDELITHLEQRHKHEWKPPKSYFNKQRMLKNMF